LPADVYTLWSPFGGNIDVIASWRQTQHYERFSFMIKVKSRGNETAEQMIRRFKKVCEKEGLTKDIKRVAYYEKPSEKRRRRSRSKPRLK
jgi:small subunit ribosomal protein S21